MERISAWKKKCRGIQIPQQAVAQRSIRLNLSFHFLHIDRRLGNFAQQLECMNLQGGNFTRVQNHWLLEEVALKVVESKVESGLEIFRRLNLFRQEDQVGSVVVFHDLTALGRRDRHPIYFDHVRQRNECATRIIGNEIVQISPCRYLKLPMPHHNFLQIPRYRG